MYMYICGHAYFWDEQKGEERRTPGFRLVVGRLRVLKPFLIARPSSAPPQPSLHPPPPRCCQCTNITDTLRLRSSTLGSTLPCWLHLQRVNMRWPPRFRVCSACCELQRPVPAGRALYALCLVCLYAGISSTLWRSSGAFYPKW